MATTLTRNLKLRINSNLTADSKYNLEKLDLLGSTFLVDTRNQLNLRADGDILLEPESADIGGSGVGGLLRIGTASHILSQVDIYADLIRLSRGISLLDEAAGGTNYLKIRYKSDIAGSLDTASDRTLSIDVQGADRSLLLGGDISTSGGSLVLNMTGNTSVTLPETGTLATLSNLESLTNKTIDADLNYLSNIRNANVASNAAIAYGKLNLLSSITDADISPSAAILYGKLNLSGSIQNADISSTANISYSKLNLSSSITNTDISGTAQISYSKLNLAGTIQNSDLSPLFALAYSNLNLAGSIQNSDIAPAAAISYSKLALAGQIQVTDLAPGFELTSANIDTDFGTSQVITEAPLRLVGPSNYTELQPAQVGQSSDLVFTLPPTAGSANQILATDGTGELFWTTASGTGTVVSYATSWTSGEGTTRVVTHNLGSTDIVVSILDLQDNTVVLVDTIEVNNGNQITLIASEAPASSWRVVVNS